MREKTKNRPEPAVGDIVKSTAGRGSGRTFLVIEKVSHEYVRICDGRTRKVENPKLKKNLHLTLIGHTDVDINSLSDAEIRKLLKQTIF